MPDVRESSQNSPASHVLLSTYPFYTTRSFFLQVGVTTWLPTGRESAGSADALARDSHFAAGLSAGNSNRGEFQGSESGCLPVFGQGGRRSAGSQCTSADLKCPGIGPCPATSPRTCRPLTPPAGADQPAW